MLYTALCCAHVCMNVCMHGHMCIVCVCVCVPRFLGDQTLEISPIEVKKWRVLEVGEILSKCTARMGVIIADFCGEVPADPGALLG